MNMSRPQSDFDALREDLRKVDDGDRRRDRGDSDPGLLQHHTYHEGQIALLKRAVDTFRPGRRRA